MIQFNRLRLSGFKSFVESAELLIEPGLTGVVGPNGCGKSNLVEALKWVMGETSAKQMRGGEMDDVIFGGTSTRPARNIAEVTVVLDNAARTAPAQFNDQVELEVTRRIERGSGSNYRVNGRDVRARDVQLLFADAATGARSTALVSQGRIGLLIAAKPSERRSLLEEAAGIGGLHSRRHEAETRLKGAEANLERLEDVLSALDGQLQSLKRQARQAARYRDLSDQIRHAEGVVLHLRWVAAIRMLEQARARLAASEGGVAGLTGGAAAAATRQAEAAVLVPTLRQAEAEAAARLQRLTLAREQLDAEAGRLGAARREVEKTVAQGTADRAREEARATDATDALARLGAERLALASEGGDEGAARARATDRLREAGAAVNAVEADLGRVTEEVAAAEAARAALLRRIEELTDRRHRLAARAAELETGRDAIAATAVPADVLAEAEMRLEAAEERVEAARTTAEDTALARDDARSAADGAREGLARETAVRTRLDAEAEALRGVLATGGPTRAGQGGGDPLPAVLDSVTAAAGFEAALAAAVGEDLLAPAVDGRAAGADPESTAGGDGGDTGSGDRGIPARRWTTLPPLDPPQALPAEAVPLGAMVAGPRCLVRRLSQVGVVADRAAGRRLASGLAPGQRLVSRDGDLWRWDGFAAAAGSGGGEVATATRLRQRNRLTELDGLLDEADRRVEEAARAAEDARFRAEEAAAAEKAAREAVRRAETDLQTIRGEHDSLVRRARTVEAKVQALEESLVQARADAEEASLELEEARAQELEEPDTAIGRARMATLKAEAAERRAAMVEARAAYDRLSRDAEARARRLAAITAEEASWEERRTAAVAHCADLADRQAAALARLERLAERPLEIEENRRRLFDATAEAERGRKAAADALALGEAALAEADRILREAEQALAVAREDRVRREAAAEQGREACRAVAQRIAERLDCTPEQVRAVAPIADDETLPTVDEADRRLDRLLRERETMGPVNLRAEQEAADLEQQTDTLKAEREDLNAAIARLRQGIAEINREGRERLLASFEAVDRHFRTLFIRLFGGGRAHLDLTESSDPLQAGLEIMASPPGKKMQTLSLLSGGEQALTALSLLFAVFLTNPAPVCVLDEVDAPLDDANVERFCTLLTEIVRLAATRFLIVTHHRMTMARMDRLFGVTMADQGVSQLVSVDLKAAEAFRDPE